MKKSMDLRRVSERAPIRIAVYSLAFLVVVGCSAAHVALAYGQSVLTQHNDNQRTGAQLHETQLTPDNVSQSFGCLYTLNVSSPLSPVTDDGGCNVKMSWPFPPGPPPGKWPNTIGAQPLYVSHVVINGVAYEVLYVATRQNWIFAFDVSNPAHSPFPQRVIWKRELRDSRGFGAEELPGMEARFSSDNRPLCGQTRGPVGIASTPVIDEPSNTMWVVYRTSSPLKRGPTANQAIPRFVDPPRYDAKFYLRKLDIRTGDKIAEQEIVVPHKPGDPAFDANKQIGRPGLLLLDGRIYVAFSGAVCDTGGGDPNQPNPHGWILALDANSLTVTGYLNTTPRGSMGGIWQSGSGLAADRNGFVYALTGNHEDNNAPELADSFLQVHFNASDNAPGQWKLEEHHFTAPNWDTLDKGDSDPASGGPVVLHSGLVLGGGKPGAFYLMNPANMATPKQYFQAFHNSWHPSIGPCELDADQSYGPNIHGSPVVWHPDGVPYSLVYHMPEKDFLKAFRAFDDGRMDERPFLATFETGIRSPRGMPGGALSLSAAAGRNGIVWVSVIQQQSGDGLNTAGEFYGRLIAFDALTLTKLWEAAENIPFAKYIPPTIGGGKVFRSAYGDHIYVYGLFPINRLTLRARSTPPSSARRLASAPARSVASLFPQFSAIRSVAAAWRDQNHLDLFMTARQQSGGSVLSTDWEPGDCHPMMKRAWRGWFPIDSRMETVNDGQPLPPGYGFIASGAAPVTALWHDTSHVDLFVAANDGKVWSIVGNPKAPTIRQVLAHGGNVAARSSEWQAWFAVAPASISVAQRQPITAVWRNPNHLDLFTVDRNGRVMSIYFENGRWQPAWFAINPNSGVAGPGQQVAAVWRNANHLDLFITGKDGKVLSTYFENNRWQPAWFPISPQSGVAAPGQTVTALWRNANHLDLFITAADGKILSTYFDNNKWQTAWFSINPGSGIAAPGQLVTALWRNPNHLDLFITGKDGRVMSTYFDNNRWQTAWFPINPNTATAEPGQPVTAIWAPGNNHLDLFITGKDGRVMSIFFDNNQWAPDGWFTI